MAIEWHNRDHEQQSQYATVGAITLEVIHHHVQGRPHEEWLLKINGKHVGYTRTRKYGKALVVQTARSQLQQALQELEEVA